MPQSPQDFITQMDNPWLRNQVETHLFFGNYKRKYIYLLLVAIYIIIFFELFAPNHAIYSLDTFTGKGFVFVIAVLISIFYQKYEIAAFFLSVIKVCLLFCFFIVFLCRIINTLRGEPYAYLLSVMGFVWLPSLEFINKVTPYQKYITLFRVAVTLPIVCIL